MEPAGANTLIWKEAEFPLGWAQNIIELLPHPVFIKDRQFRWVVLNQAIANMLGHPRESMLGKTDFDFFPPSEAAFFREKDAEMFALGHPVHSPEETITDREGRRHVLSTIKVPVRNSFGDITHLVGIISDITPLKEAQDALRASNEQLEERVAQRTRELRGAQEELLRQERLALLGRISGGLAHQIRNPLASILNAVQIMRQSLPSHSDEQVLHALHIIEEEAWGANRVITGLVDPLRNFPTDRSSERLNDLVAQSIASANLPARIQFRSNVEPLAVLVNRSQVVSALANLLQNAADAMPEGGLIEFRGFDAGESVVLTVEDQGCGISEDIAARLFEPLVTNKPLGLGLGLATARTLLERQGGTLRLTHSAPHACFELMLPKASPLELPREEPPTGVPGDSRG